MAKYHTSSELKRLINKYLDGKASEEEKAFLEKYYSFFDTEADILDSLPETQVAKIAGRMEANINKQKERSLIVKLWPYYKHIAAAVLLLAGGFFTYRLLQKNSKPVINEIQFTHVAPLSSTENAVMLTLSDGKKVRVEDMQSGMVAKESGVKIEKSADGTLIYTATHSLFWYDSEDKYNTISTPNGKLSQITLPDGTKVWLNAMSSLTYPVAFNGKQRMVELNGEAYFEVFKNKAQPFIVKTANTETKVLGTHFNVSAYTDDNTTKTTLIEGRVAVKNLGVEKILKPGQQSITYNGKMGITVNEVDTEEVQAWKNGYFVFNNINIKEVMKVIARWYDIEVVYENGSQNELFIGTVSRFESVDKLLKTIALTGGVQFKIQENGKRKMVHVIGADQ